MEEKHVAETVGKEAGKQAKAAPLQITAIVLSSVAIVSAGAIFLTRKQPEPESQNPAVLKIGMESTVITNEEDAANIEPGEPFSFTTWYERDIYITNGKDAKCSIGNDASNYYENLYIQIYLNGEDGMMDEGQKLYVSKLIPRGSHIESFTAEMELAPGEYEGTLIYSSIDDNGALVKDLPFVVDIHVE